MAAAPALSGQPRADGFSPARLYARRVCWRRRGPYAEAQRPGSRSGRAPAHPLA